MPIYISLPSIGHFNPSNEYRIYHRKSLSIYRCNNEKRRIKTYKFYLRNLKKLMTKRNCQVKQTKTVSTKDR
jgi:hypothetical protein